MPLQARVRRERRAVTKKFSPPQQFPRKRCKNCPKMFPKTRPNREFCSPACKKEFHRHGSAFGPLKETLQNLVKGWLKEFRAEIEARIDKLEAGALIDKEVISWHQQEGTQSDKSYAR